MAQLGPMVVVAENPAAELIGVLVKAGAFPIVEASWADAPAAIAEIEPAAMLIAEPGPAPDLASLQALTRKIEKRSGPLMPVLARVTDDSDIVIPCALPIDCNDADARLVARLRSALRIRTMHATVLRRSGAEAKQSRIPASFLAGLLDHSTILCVGRGGSYPALSVAIGERVGIIGALSIETAARYLNARDIEGIVIGDGFSPRVVEALLTVLAEDARFRDLPVGLLGGAAGSGDERLPNLIRVNSGPAGLVERMLPFVQLQAFEAHLRRVLASLDTDGVVDPETGLLASDAFWRDLDRAVTDTEDNGGSLSIARFSFEEMADRRASIDAARLFSRLVRKIDFACRDRDGAIVAAFTETDLRSAHVVARRLASVLKHTVLSPDRSQCAIKPTVTLATLKPNDNLSTLVARIGTYPEVAAS